MVVVVAEGEGEGEVWCRLEGETRVRVEHPGSATIPLCEYQPAQAQGLG